MAQNNKVNGYDLHPVNPFKPIFLSSYCHIFFQNNKSQTVRIILSELSEI